MKLRFFYCAIGYQCIVGISIHESSSYVCNGRSFLYIAPFVLAQEEDQRRLDAEQRLERELEVQRARVSL